VGVGQAGDPVGRGREQHPVSVAGGGDAECGGQVCLSGSRGAEEHDVAGLGEESAGGQGPDLLTGCWLGVEVEVLQRLGRRESGCADPQLGARGVAGTDFTFEDCSEVVLMGPARITGLVGQPGGDLGDSWCLQRGREIGDLFDRFVARSGLRSALRGTHQLTSPSLVRPNARS